MTEDEMVRWYHQLHGHEFKQALGSILGSEKSPGEGHDNPLQYSCPKNPMDRGAWWATVYRVTQSQTRLK